MGKLATAFLLVIALSCGLTTVSFAVPKKAVTMAHTLHIDSSRVNLRKFDTAAVNAYLKQPQFDYHERDKPVSAWSRFWAWLWHIIENWFSSRTSTSNAEPGLMIKYLLLAVAIGLIVWFIIKVAGIDNIFNRQSQKVTLSYTEELETIHGISFDEQIEKAVTGGNYRLAVRLLYLQSLKQLNDANLIHWQIEKTNLAYLDELQNEQQKHNFKLLTRQFEYVWYGGFSVDKQLYHEISRLFANFSKTLA